MKASLRKLPALIAIALGAAAAAQPCEWSPLGGGLDPGFTGASVAALTVFDDGRGEALYAGGSFRTTEREIVNHIARWDGAEWSALGPGLSSGIVFDLIVFDDGRGGGPALYAGGSFETSGGKPVRGIARWDGASWTEVGGGIEGGASKPSVNSLCVFDDGRGPALYAGGSFGSVGGAPETNFIGRWDGESWSSVGGGMSSHVHWLGAVDDGGGLVLYASGLFKSAGGTPANYVAKWDGRSWSEVPGFNRSAAFVEFDDGSGPALYAAGGFTTAGGAPANYVARWDGELWSEVGGGLSRAAGALAVLDDGSGPALYVGGAFSMAGETPVNGIARWDGKEWSALGAGVGGSPVPAVAEIAGFDDGRGLALYVGGNFLTAGGVPANNIARWRCTACPADCDGSGDLTFFDFLCFQDLFAALDPGADCDGDGEFTFFDFLCFQNAFAAGCP